MKLLAMFSAIFFVFLTSQTYSQDGNLWKSLSATKYEEYIMNKYSVDQRDFLDSISRVNPQVNPETISILPGWINDKTVCFSLGALGTSYLFNGSISQDSNIFTGTGNFLGDKEGIATLVFAPLLLGKTFENEKLIESSLVASESMIATGIATQMLKLIIREPRPYDPTYPGEPKNPDGNPSGHASATAAFAAAMSEMYDWDPKIAIPLHILPLVTAYARVATKNHTESQVLGGFLLGEFIGIANARLRKNYETPFEVSPLPDPRAVGIMVSWSF